MSHQLDPISRAVLQVFDTPPAWMIATCNQACAHARRAVALRKRGIEGEASFAYGIALGMTSTIVVYAHTTLGPITSGDLGRKLHAALDSIREGA